VLFNQVEVNLLLNTVNLNLADLEGNQNMIIILPVLNV
jgi:hypothetical protein